MRCLLGIAHGLPAAVAHDLNNSNTTRAFDEGGQSEGGQSAVLERMEVLERSGDEAGYRPAEWSGRFIERAKGLVKRTRARRLLVLIDPLHEVTFAPADRSMTIERQELHHYTETELDRLRVQLVRRLLASTSSLNPAVIAVNKSTKVPTGRKMGLDDVYGGVDLIYPATTVLLLDRDDRRATGDDVPHLLAVAKAEHGVTGEVPLTCRPATRSFVTRGSGQRVGATGGGNLLATRERTTGKRGGKP